MRFESRAYMQTITWCIVCFFLCAFYVTIGEFNLFAILVGLIVFSSSTAEHGDFAWHIGKRYQVRDELSFNAANEVSLKTIIISANSKQTFIRVSLSLMQFDARDPWIYVALFLDRTNNYGMNESKLIVFKFINKSHDRMCLIALRINSKWVYCQPGGW